jgi:PAS domain S-box-containing protein
MKLGASSWSTALIGIVTIKAVLSLAVKPGSFVVSYSGISYLVLLILATWFAMRNSIQNTLGGRLFWAVVATAYGLWSAHQALKLYYELGLRIEVPVNSIDDSLLFLHVGALVAAVAILPHRDISSRKQNTAVANALFVTLLWIFIYGYAVFPYQYLLPSGTAFSYNLRFDILYLLENLALVLTVGVLAFRVKAPWKSVYFHLLAASTLYALSSTVANLAIDSGGYVNGKLYGLGLTAAVCWSLWIPLGARQVPTPRANSIPFDDAIPRSRVSVWAMVVVVMVSIPIIWELFERSENPGFRTVRLVFAVVMIVCLASTAYVKEHLAKREIVSEAQAALQESGEREEENKERFRSVFDYSAVGMALVSCDGRWIRVNRALCEILGYPEQELLATDFQSLTHPDDLDSDLSYAKKVFTGQLRFYHMEKRYIHKQGHVIWVALTASAVPDASGKVSYGIAQVQDITGRKNAEATLRLNQEKLQSLAGRLITVQEEERKRIARDLHDDLSQRLALLCIDLDLLRQGLPGGEETARELERMRRETDELVVDMRRLSHDQHHPQLALGLEHGVTSFCNGFSKQHGIATNLVQEGDLTRIPETVSFALFRVLQEAMSNVAKHSGADRVVVTVGVRGDEAVLRVLDEGRGFEAESDRGLGLISMRERLRLVGGTMRVRSSPEKGTDVEAVVPLPISALSATA